MRANAVILVVIGLLLLVGTVAAIIPDQVIITSDKSYLVANNVDQSVINVIVTNTTSGFAGPIPGAAVTFSVDPVYGTLSLTSGTTNASGSVSSIFKVNKKSGFANITVAVFYNDGNNSFSQNKIIPQNIDHNKAYYATFSHPFEGEVNTTVPLNISFTDYYGNPIDRLINSNQSHTINLHVYGPPPDDCNFVGYGHEILNKELDQYGNISTEIKLTSGAGPNSITMDQFELIPPPSQRIITAVSSDVSSMQSSINPSSPPGVPADGTSKFSIVYTLYDKFRNPASQKELWVNTSVGESMKFKTDSLGRIAITYGPQIDPGIITIHAASVVNPLVNTSDNVEFTSTAGTTMVITANPEVMVSRDKNPDANSIIIAKITNKMGGTVPNATVVFSLGTDLTGPYNVTNFSSFSNTSSLKTTNATTDENGEAAVTFYPGGFTTNPIAVNFSSTASGQVVINAKWTNASGILFSKDITVKWKNYPYLSARTSLNPDRINVNDTVDITINLLADGWAMQPLPIDVMLTTDRSGSMLKDEPDDRMVSVMNASHSFMSAMHVSSSQDHVGLVSFGTQGWANLTPTNYYSNTYHKWRWDWSNVYPSGWWWVSKDNDYECDYCGNDYCDNYNTSSYHQQYVNAHYPGNNRNYAEYATMEQTLSSSSSTISDSIDKMVPTGGTPMRLGIYTAINEIIANGTRPNTVKAIIVLSDGDYNLYGDPLARGTGSSGTNYNDLDQDYKTFSGLGSGQFSEQNMSVYAKDHNIRIYTIGYGSDLSGGGEAALIALANGTNGGKYYKASAANINDIYKAIAGDLQDTAGVDTKMVTDFSKVNVTGVDVNGSEVFDYVYHPTASTKIIWQNTTTEVTNQGAEWAADNKLDFTIGTMKVGQTWEATFRLKVKKDGTIDVFGPNSALIFNNSGNKETLILPHTYLTVNPNIITGFEQEQIDVAGTCSLLDQNKAIVPINWWTTYTGGNTTIFEEVNYVDDTGAHINFYKGSYTVPGSNFAQRSTIFDMKTVPQNRYYDIEVHTYSANAQDSTIACGGALYNSSGRTFIKLN